MDPAEFSEVYRNNITMVRQRAWRILGAKDKAEDMAQLTFVNFIAFRRKGQREDDTGAFLYRAVTNQCLNFLRSEKSQSRMLQNQWVEPSTMASDAKAVDEIAIRRLFRALPYDLALVGSYHYLDGLTHYEIADLLNIPRRTVGNRLEKFVELARQALGTQDTSRLEPSYEG